MRPLTPSGVYSIGYNSDMSAFAPKAHLVAAVWNWGPFYREIAAQVQQNRWKSEAFWHGIDKGIVDISPMAAVVPQDVQQKVLSARQSIIEGKTKIFVGPVRDQAGKVRIPEGVTATDDELLGMTWFVRGVVGTTE